MTEETLVMGRGGLVPTLRRVRGAVVLKHADRMTSGIPDVSFTWGGYTSWIEAKLVRDEVVIQRGQQLHSMHQLGKAGSAFYVHYELNSFNGKRATAMLDAATLQVIWRRPGFCHVAIAQFLKRHHESLATNAPA